MYTRSPVLFFLIFSLSFPQVIHGVELRVLSYNILGMKPGTDPESRIQHIISNLKQIDADIIGLQEINESGTGLNNQAQLIADSLGAFFGEEFHVYQEFTHYSWDNQFREYIGIITRFPVSDEDYGQLIVGVFPRKVVWNSIVTALGTINVFNTHLSFNSTATRQLQVQQIIGFINTKEELSPGVASILTGDFNDTPESETIRLLTDPQTGPHYIDTYAFSNPHSPGYTVPAEAPNSRIDFIFEKSTGSLAIDTSMVVLDIPYDGINYCSDHLGVLTVFKRGHSKTTIKPNTNMHNLLPPRPNPSSTMAFIPFNLSHDSRVLISIYDLFGRHIRTIENGLRPAGLSRAAWDFRDFRGITVSSATYIVRLEVDDTVVDRRIAFIH